MEWFPIGVGLLVGVLMLGVWIVLLARHQVVEVRDGSKAIRFHLVAEWLTAGLLLVGAAALWIGISWAGPLLATALGAALYTTINSPGYYADRGERAPVVMFIVLAVLIASAIVVLLLGGS